MLQVIAITFIHVDIEDGQTCPWDYLEIYNGIELV